MHAQRFLQTHQLVARKVPLTTRRFLYYSNVCACSAQLASAVYLSLPVQRLSSACRGYGLDPIETLAGRDRSSLDLAGRNKYSQYYGPFSFNEARSLAFILFWLGNVLGRFKWWTEIIHRTFYIDAQRTAHELARTLRDCLPTWLWLCSWRIAVSNCFNIGTKRQPISYGCRYTSHEAHALWRKRGV
jgi:hypothetical protein